MSSVHDIIPWAGHVNYAASKGGVHLLMETMAQEMAPERIRINAIAPGAIQTPMLDAALIDQGLTVDDITPMMSLIGRIGQPREVAQGTLWMASDLASYVHGTTLHVGGGFELI